MNFPSWERPGIVPGLGENTGRRPHTGRITSNCMDRMVEAANNTLNSNMSKDKVNTCLVNSILPKMDEIISPQVKQLMSPSTLPIKSDKPSAIEKCFVIRGGSVIDGDLVVPADVMITDGKISAIAQGLTAPTDTPEIDATNLIVHLGLVDFSAFSNVIDHQGSINSKKLHEASVSAAMSGVTTMIDTVFTNGGQSSLSMVAAYIKAVETCDLQCSVTLRVGFRCLTDNSAADIESLVTRHKIHSFLLPISQSDQRLAEDGQEKMCMLFQALRICRTLGVIPTICLNQSSESGTIEKVTDVYLASLVIGIAKKCGCPIILSPVRDRETMFQIYTAQREHPRLYVYADWAVSEFKNELTDTMHTMAPFIAADDNVILSSGQVYSSAEDGNFRPDSWMKVAWHGVMNPGWANEGHMTAINSQRPAQLTGLYPRKGRLHIDADADLILWSPADRARPVFVISGGRIVVQYGKPKSNSPGVFNAKNRAGYIWPTTSTCCLLTAVQDKLAEFYREKTGEIEDNPIDKLLVNNFEPIRLGPKGDGIPMKVTSSATESNVSKSPAMRAVYYSAFKLSGEQDGDDKPIRSSVRIWQNMRDSPRPY